MLNAITRKINATLGQCELTFLNRVPIDMTLARRQHQDYEAALARLGCRVQTLPAEPGSADSVFIEDTALVLDQFAVICRPGAVSRRREVDCVAPLLEQYRDLAYIRPPGTLDGGDLLAVGSVIFAGLSSRSNRNGIDQLGELVKEHGYSVTAVETSKCLHLKSAVSLVAPGTLLLNPDWVDRAAFVDYKIIETDPREPHAANALLIEKQLVYPSSFPRTLDKLSKQGIGVIPLDLSELQKAEGAVSCCSLVFHSQDHDSQGA